MIIKTTCDIKYDDKIKHFMLLSKPKNVNIPIFHVNGILSSPLFVKILDKQKYSRLLPMSYQSFIEKATYDKAMIWPPGEMKLREISCLLDTIARREKNGEITVKPPEGLKIETSSIRKVSNFTEHDEEIFDLDLPYYLQGYRNVYNVSYDWLHYFYNTSEVFERLKEKIESEVKRTGQKAVIAGYSLGGHFVRYFLNDYSNEEWNMKFIAGAQFGASVIGGALSVIEGIVKGIFPLSKSQDLRFAKHMPSYVAMFPNFNVNEKIIKITNEDDREESFLDASQLFSQLKKKGFVDETVDLIYQKGLNFFKEDIKDPKVKSNFILNSGSHALTGFNVIIKDGKRKIKKVFGPGDGVVPSNGMQYVMKKWSNVTCHDFNTKDNNFSHLRMINQPEFAKFTREFIDNL